MSIVVKPISAMLTKDLDTFGKMDPYVVCIIGSESKRGKTHQNGGKKPQWTDTFVFNTKNQLMKVEVYDQDSFSSDLIGSGTLNLNQLYNNPNRTQNQYVDLVKNGKSSGRILISIEYQGQSMGGNNNNMGSGNNNMPSNNNNNWGNNNNNNNGWGNNNIPNNNNNGWGNNMPVNNNNNNNGWGNNVPANNNNNNGWGTNTPIIPIIPPIIPTQNNNGWGNNMPINSNNNDGWGNTNAMSNNNNNGWGNNNMPSNNNNNGWGNNNNNTNNNGWGNNNNMPNNNNFGNNNNSSGNIKYIIKPIQGNLTRDLDTFSKMDPFVSVKIGNQVQRTKTANGGGKKPKFFDTLTINATTNDTFMQVSVFDQDVTTNQLVGQGNLDLKKIMNNMNMAQNQYVDLIYHGKSGAQQSNQHGW